MVSLEAGAFAAPLPAPDMFPNASTSPYVKSTAMETHRAARIPKRFIAIPFPGFCQSTISPRELSPTGLPPAGPEPRVAGGRDRMLRIDDRHPGVVEILLSRDELE